MTQAFPLQWPDHTPRTKNRVDSVFRVDPTKAFDEMRAELDRFKAKGVVISSNIPLRRDGTPYRDGLRELLEDPGVAVYFQRGTPLCLAVDAYRRPWENCRAIYAAVKGLRDMERHGARQVVAQAFRGFAALPAPGSTGGAARRAWWVVLGCKSESATKDEINACWKAKARAATEAELLELNLAREDALRSCNG